jgi:hypothetical protein
MSGQRIIPYPAKVTRFKQMIVDHLYLRCTFFGIIALIFCSNALIALEPQLSCEKIWGEMTWEGMEFHRYKLRAEHFPPQKKFLLIVKNFDGYQTETFTYHSNNKGHLILQPLENVEGDIYAICPAKRGERLTFIMQSEDVSYSTEVVPFPLEMKSKKGVKLNLELQGEKGEKFLFIAEGLKANENVELYGEFQGRKISFEVPQATPLGELFALLTFPEDQEGGHAKLVLKRKQEEVAFRFECGAPALRIVGACCFEIK